MFPTNNKILLAACFLLAACLVHPHTGPADEPKIFKYYIQAEKVLWDYLPDGRNNIDDNYE